LGGVLGPPRELEREGVWPLEFVHLSMMVTILKSNLELVIIFISLNSSSVASTINYLVNAEHVINIWNSLPLTVCRFLYTRIIL